jgi:hypothetical protein
MIEVRGHMREADTAPLTESSRDQAFFYPVEK